MSGSVFLSVATGVLAAWTTAHGFASDFSGLSLVGGAMEVGDTIVLTPATAWTTGAAWAPETQYFEHGFETVFDFQISERHGYPPDQPGADGFAFVIQNAGAAAMGDDGESIGYGTDEYGSVVRGGIPRSLAVEFDAYPNFEFGEAGPHVSIQTAYGSPNRALPSYSLGTKALPVLLDDDVHSAKITYRSGMLSVYVDNMTAPVTSAEIDLGDVLDSDDGKAWVGFTAATGGYFEQHVVSNWTFDGEQPPVPPMPRIHSVIVGCEQMRLAATYHGRKDAQALADAIRTLPNAAAPVIVPIDSNTVNAKDLVQEAIQTTAQACGPDDTLLVFLGGHGDETNGDVSLQIDLGGNAKSFVTKTNLVHWLTDASADIDEINKLVVVPGCHSGKLWESNGIGAEGLSDLERIGFLAGAPGDEDAFIIPDVLGLDEEAGMTPLTITLVEGLTRTDTTRSRADANSDGRITFDELNDFVLSANDQNFAWLWYPFNFHGWSDMEGQAWPILSPFGGEAPFFYQADCANTPDLAGVGLVGSVADPTFPEPGDANGDGYVGSADLDIVRSHWGESVAPGDAASGELSGDGMVSSADLDLVRGNWGNVYATVVPEPGMCALASFGLLVFGFRVQRK